ncbi:unnamed protein product [Prorocentrum cordatum]|uniref:Sulfotransferase n=1 Tax=Prorocentrum cordatum TaxID=2364126 RepID=A0ABN9TRB1_9DINO|nr:unnamed protein product [Polarella glacialis]
MLYATTMGQYTGCSIFGGRYWDIKLRIPYNCCATSPSESRGGFCMPHRCSRWQVANELVPQFWRPMIASQYKEPCKVCRPLIKASELWSWEHLSLDFAIVGLDRCGTSSLKRNLQQHPEIGFSTPADSEDRFFYTHAVMPRRALVEHFNDMQHANGKVRPKLLGLKDPTILLSVQKMEAITRVPGLKVIVAVCDLVSRLDKHGGAQKGLFYDNRCAYVGDYGADGRTCRPSAGEVLRDPAIYRRWRVGRSLFRLSQDVPDERLLVVRQEDVRVRPCAVYAGIPAAAVARFLGAEAPHPWRLSRANSVRGHRTDLCRNATLQRGFRALVARDAVLQDTFLQQRGHAAERGPTRCERAEELDEGARAEPWSLVDCRSLSARHGARGTAGARTKTDTAQA